MFPFLETIKIEDCCLHYPELHLQRMQSTCLEVYGEKKGCDKLIDEIQMLAQQIRLKTKLSIRYNLYQHNFSWQTYHMRKVETLFLIENNSIDYHLKYTDRQIFDEYSQRVGNENDFIIVQNEKLTDATFANLAFWNGSEWHTPLHPLLKGTKRNYLLQNKQLKEHEILVADLKLYEKVSLINAMLELGESEIDTNRIRFLSEIY